MKRQLIGKIDSLSEGFLYYITKDGKIYRTPTNSNTGRAAAERQAECYSPNSVGLINLDEAIAKAKQEVHQEYLLLFTEAEREYREMEQEVIRLKSELQVYKDCIKHENSI